MCASLADRVAIVTGAGRGIGEGIAQALADRGAFVVCADRDAASAKATAARLRDSSSVRLDVASSGECDRVIQEVIDQHGRLDVVVNNAGINRDAILHKMTDEQWDEVIAVDLSGVFYMVRAAGRFMRRQKSGRIINISSVSAFGAVGQANYSAAKAGVIGLTKTAALELARHGVTVNAIAPGFVDTAMTRALPAELRADVLAKLPVGDPGQPQDIAAVVAFLASDEARYVVGQVITVSGGLPL